MNKEYELESLERDISSTFATFARITKHIQAGDLYLALQNIQYAMSYLSDANHTFDRYIDQATRESIDWQKLTKNAMNNAKKAMKNE